MGRPPVGLRIVLLIRQTSTASDQFEQPIGGSQARSSGSGRSTLAYGSALRTSISTKAAAVSIGVN
jgi:hypothetical protein